MSDTDGAGEPGRFTAAGVFLDDDGHPVGEVTFTPTGWAPIVATPDETGRVEVELPCAGAGVTEIEVAAGHKAASLLAPGEPPNGGGALDLNHTLPDVAAHVAAPADTVDLEAEVAKLSARVAALEAAARAKRRR